MTNFVLAARKREFRGPSTPGTTEKPCAVCGELLILSPASQARIARGYQAYCAGCIQPILAANKKNVAAELPTLAELMEAFGLTGHN